MRAFQNRLKNSIAFVLPKIWAIDFIMAVAKQNEQ